MGDIDSTGLVQYRYSLWAVVDAVMNLQCQFKCWIDKKLLILNEVFCSTHLVN